MARTSLLRCGRKAYLRHRTRKKRLLRCAINDPSPGGMSYSDRSVREIRVSKSVKMVILFTKILNKMVPERVFFTHSLSLKNGYFFISGTTDKGCVFFQRRQIHMLVQETSECPSPHPLPQGSPLIEDPSNVHEQLSRGTRSAV